MAQEAARYTVSSDSGRLDLHRIHRWLGEESYWAEGRPLDVIRRSLENSLVFGAYDDEVQVGVARVVTDFATFGWLCDVFVDREHRGCGVGKLLIASIVEHPALRELPFMVLATRDAHGLYEAYGGFHAIEKPTSWMVRRASTPSPDRPRPTEA